MTQKQIPNPGNPEERPGLPGQTDPRRHPSNTPSETQETPREDQPRPQEMQPNVEQEQYPEGNDVSKTGTNATPAKDNGLSGEGSRGEKATTGSSYFDPSRLASRNEQGNRSPQK